MRRRSVGASILLSVLIVQLNKNKLSVKPTMKMLSAMGEFHSQTFINPPCPPPYLSILYYSNAYLKVYQLQVKNNPYFLYKTQGLVDKEGQVASLLRSRRAMLTDLIIISIRYLGQAIKA